MTLMFFLTATACTESAAHLDLIITLAVRNSSHLVYIIVNYG